LEFWKHCLPTLLRYFTVMILLPNLLSAVHQLSAKPQTNVAHSGKPTIAYLLLHTYLLPSPLGISLGVRGFHLLPFHLFVFHYTDAPIYIFLFSRLIRSNEHIFGCQTEMPLPCHQESVADHKKPSREGFFDDILEMPLPCHQEPMADHKKPSREGFFDDIFSYVSCRPCRDTCNNGNPTNSHTVFGLLQCAFFHISDLSNALCMKDSDTLYSPQGLARDQLG
jgi:hypothetical protein